MVRVISYPQRVTGTWRFDLVVERLIGRCDQVIVPSLVLQDIATRIWRLPANKVRYLPNGIDCDRFARQPDRELVTALQIPNDALVIGTVAALRKEKNLIRLVRVFASLPRDIEARLVIIGDGPERPALEQVIANLNVSARVVLVGALGQPERLLGRFDIFALSSDTEQMPYSVLEAMAAGLPVVSTNVGDVKRMLTPENADFIVPIVDENRLAHQLLRLLQNSVLRVRIGKANQQKVHSEYSMEHMVDCYATLFSAAI